MDDIEKIINILDNFAKSDAGRLKLNMSEELESGQTKQIHHHGRCDIGSPWAKGQAFDVLEEDITNYHRKSRMELITHLIDLEWKAFDKVHNFGGRASCQDDFATFQLMRKSQYLTWTNEMIKSFTADFEAANESGRNLIAEKYAWMMETTSPDEFADIVHKLPQIQSEKRTIINEIVKIQVAWMEDFQAEQPEVTAQMRSIHTYEDTPYNTSYETYLRGELLTYSDETLLLYGRFIADLSSQGKNLAKMTVTNTLNN